MTSLRVFVLWMNPLFLSSLKLMLSQQQLEWVGEAAAASDFESQLLQARPNIILIEGNEEEVTRQAMHIIQDEPGDIRIVGLNLEDNQAKLFEVERGLILRKDDLLKMIFKEWNL